MDLGSNWLHLELSCYDCTSLYDARVDKVLQRLGVCSYSSCGPLYLDADAMDATFYDEIHFLAFVSPKKGN